MKTTSNWPNSAAMVSSAGPTRTSILFACGEVVDQPSRSPSASPRWKADRRKPPSEQYQCVPSIQIGNVTFHNRKK